MSVAAPAARVGRSATAVLVLVCVAQFVLVLDDTIVNVALPTIGTDLGVSPARLSWVVNAYFLTFGGFLLVGGRVADRVGSRRMLQVGLVGFGAASAACAAAPSAEVLVAARGLQGLAAAFLSPAALAVLLRAHPDEPERGRALAIWASLLGAGAASGLLLGGAIVELLDWRWIFLVNVPVTAVAVALVPRLVPADEAVDGGPRPGVASATLGTLALLGLVFTVVETEGAGWTSARTLGSFAAVAALAAAFVLAERRAPAPLVPRAVLARRRAMAANGLVLVAAGGLMAMFFVQSLYLQRVLGLSPLETGLAFLPFSVGMGVSSVVGERRLAGAPPGLAVAAGLLVAGTGMGWMSTFTPGSGYATAVLPALVVTALGIGSAFVAVMSLATGGAGAGGGSASALVTACQQIGGSIGIAAAVTVASAGAEDAVRDGLAPAAALSEGFARAFAAQSALLVAGAVLALVLLRRRSA